MPEQTELAVRGHVRGGSSVETEKSEGQRSRLNAGDSSINPNANAAKVAEAMRLGGERDE
jgi:hypothetical protein